MKNNRTKYKYYLLVFLLLLLSGPALFPVMIDLIILVDIGGFMLLSGSLVFGAKLYWESILGIYTNAREVAQSIFLKRTGK